MGRAEEGQPEPSSVEGSCCGPMFHRELRRGLSQVSQTIIYRTTSHLSLTTHHLSLNNEFLVFCVSLDIQGDLDSLQRFGKTELTSLWANFTRNTVAAHSPTNESSGSTGVKKAALRARLQRPNWLDEFTRVILGLRNAPPPPPPPPPPTAKQNLGSSAVELTYGTPLTEVEFLDAI